MLPNQLVARAYLWRSAWTWILVRATATMFAFAAGAINARLSTFALVAICVVCVLLGFVDIARRGENELLTNLGICKRVLAAFLLLPAIGRTDCIVGACHVTPFLVADSVTKSFGDRRVLSSASLRAVPGELRVVLGRNGIGKSTLLKIAAGRMQPDSGAVHVLGRAHLAVHPAKLARCGLFFLPDRDLLSNAFTVRQQLLMMTAQFPGGSIEESTSMVGLEGKLDRTPQQLSGGERRRAELAMVLVRQPRCFLADEPYRGISPIESELLTTVLRTLVSRGVAVLVTGHEVPTLMAAADHITWCTSGTTYELGAPHEARAHDAFRRDYLGGR